MRKLAATALSVPIIASLYLPLVLRRSIAARLGLAVVIGGFLAVAALGTLATPGTRATPASTPAPVATSEFGPAVRTNVALTTPLTVSFSRPMDRASVAAALAVSPDASVRLAWDATNTTLTVAPSDGWSVATF